MLKLVAHHMQGLVVYQVRDENGEVLKVNKVPTERAVKWTDKREIHKNTINLFREIIKNNEPKT